MSATHATQTHFAMDGEWPYPPPPIREWDAPIDPKWGEPETWPLLRRAVARRAIALYWQEQTQRALCAPGGAGRAADRGAFESEF